MGKVRLAARKPLAAWALTGSALIVLAAALVLLGLNASQPDASRLGTGRIGFYVLASVGALAYAGAGGLIARRVPGNAIGWLLSLAGLSLTVAMLAEQDLGRIVSRTVAYAIVTGLLAGLYAGLVLLATHVIRLTSPVAVAGATLAAAAPVRPAPLPGPEKGGPPVQPGQV